MDILLQDLWPAIAELNFYKAKFQRLETLNVKGVLTSGLQYLTNLMAVISTSMTIRTLISIISSHLGTIIVKPRTFSTRLSIIFIPIIYTFEYWLAIYNFYI